jgi:hypothetical protein
MNKKDCKYCGGKFKISTTEYTIRSRHSEKNETTIENLGVNECTICGHAEMHESSERYIEMIRAIIRKEMELQANTSRNHVMKDDDSRDNNLQYFKKIFKKFIG